MVSRMVIILMRLVARGVKGVLEQPATSVMDKVRVMREIAGMVFKGSLCTGSRGAETMKPTLLPSSDPWVKAFLRQGQEG